MAKKKKKVNSYEDYDFNKLCLYGGIDCIVTLNLLKKQWPKVIEEPSYKLGSKVVKAPSILWETENVKMPAHEFILDMQIAGMKYDVERNRAMKDKMYKEIHALETSILDAIKKDNATFNMDSGTQLGNFLYREMGFKAPMETANGDDSTSGEALMALFKEHKLQWLADMAKRKDLNSVYNSFLSDYVDDYVKSDGRIHPQYNLHGTSSHRISSDKPNLLNIPSPKHGYNVRDLYTVEDGMVFLAFDFSSCEVKVLGALSKDPKLLDAIASGLDFHSYTASTINDIPYEDFVAVLNDDEHKLKKHYKALRQNAKAVTFGILYGSSIGGIAMGLGISNEEAQRLVDLYFKTFPLIKAYVDESHLMAEQNHWVFTPFGQRKMQFGTLPAYKYTAVYNASKRNAQNSRIQSTASTLGLMAFTKLNEEIKKLGGRAVCTVYDSVELEVPFPKIAEAIETAFYCMDDWPVEVYDWLDLPIGTDGELGFRWGTVKHIHRGITQQECEDLLSVLEPERFAKTKQMWLHK